MPLPVHVMMTSTPDERDVQVTVPVWREEREQCLLYNGVSVLCSEGTL